MDRNAEHRYETCYATLGLHPPCSWDDVRLAYRRRVRSCHPDLVQGFSAERNREFRRVVRAYHELLAYHRVHGELPESIPPRKRTLALASFRHRPGQHRRSSRFSPRWRQVVPRLHQAAFALFVAGVGSAAAIGSIVNVDVSSEGAQGTGRLGIGMQPTDVVDVQGVPHYTKGSVWFYGDSGVVFDGNCVIGWENQPPFPLRTIVRTMHHGSRQEVDDCRGRD